MQTVSPKACRFRRYGSQENIDAFQLGVPNNKYTHLLRQNVAPFSLGVPGTQERSDAFEKTDGRKLAILSTWLATFV